MNAVEQGAERIARDWLKVKNGERVVILTEEDCRSQAEALRRQAERLGASAVTLVLSAGGGQLGEELERFPVSEHIDRSDTVVGATKYSVLTARKIAAAVRAGKRFLSLPLFTGSGAEMLSLPFLAMPPQQASEMAARLLKGLRGRECIRITTAPGTDLRLSLKGRQAGAFTGDFSHGSCCDSCCFEVFAAPREDSVEGILVADASLGYIGAPEQPVRLRFSAGRLTEIEKSPAGDRLRDYISAFGDDRMNVAGELGIGLNTHGHCRGDCYIEDESVYGTFHIGMGRNLTFGGQHDAAGHYDLVAWGPDLYADGRLLCRAGEIVF